MAPDWRRSHGGFRGGAVETEKSGFPAGGPVQHMQEDLRLRSEQEAATGVERHNVHPVNKAEQRQLYAGRLKVYAKLAHGRFRTLKWLVMAVTLGIYYGLPWLRWPRGPDLPDQAVLLDIAHNR